jgi:dTDP-4-dehydrorhamnose reductase
MTVKKVIVTGANGQLGTALREISGAADNFEWVFLNRSNVDITDMNAVEFFLEKAVTSKTVLINCSAYTDVEKAEDEPEKAFRINRDGAYNLALASQKYGFKLLHISTDFVFNGQKGSLYNEDDDADPISVYGKSKYEGEKAVLSVKDNCLVIRTSWLYSATHNTFMKKILAKADNSFELTVVNDEKGSPTSADSFASDLVKMLKVIFPVVNFRSEVFHYCNTGSVSRYDFACKIVELAGKRSKVLPISSKEFKMKAKRPADSSLDNSKIITDFGLNIPTWEEALEATLRKLS